MRMNADKFNGSTSKTCSWFCLCVYLRLIGVFEFERPALNLRQRLEMGGDAASERVELVTAFQQ